MPSFSQCWVNFKWQQLLISPRGEIFERAARGARANNDVKTFLLEAPGRWGSYGFAGAQVWERWVCSRGGHTFQCPAVQTSEVRLNLTCFQKRSHSSPQVHGWIFHERGICEITAEWVTLQLHTADFGACIIDGENPPQLQKQQQIFAAVPFVRDAGEGGMASPLKLLSLVLVPWKEARKIKLLLRNKQVILQKSWQLGYAVLNPGKKADLWFHKAEMSFWLEKSGWGEKGKKDIKNQKTFLWEV